VSAATAVEGHAGAVRVAEVVAAEVPVAVVATAAIDEWLER